MVQFYGISNISQSMFHKVPFASNLAGSNLFLDNYWTPENPDGYYSEPRLGAKSDGDLYIFDGSYLRLKTMELSYRLPESLTRSMAISGARIFINGNNLLFWSDLPIDMERGNLSSGDTNIHPAFRQYNMGINIDF